MSLLKRITTWYKGWDGELTIKLGQWLFLDKKTYHVFNNVFLPMFGGGSTQIDHIIISVYGIFVTETKNWNGWIYGKENEPTWTKTFPNKKYKTPNPLRQNYGHIKTISEILKITEKILTEKEVSDIGDGIKAYRLPSSFKTKRKHIQHVQSIKENKFRS